MFKTPSDLSTFLKLFSDCFHIQSNLVTLLQKPKLSDAHIQQAQARAKDQYNNNTYNNNNSNNNQVVTNTTAIQTQTTSLPVTSNINNRMQSPVIRNNVDFKLNEPVTVNNNVNVTNAINNNTIQSAGVVKSQPNSGFDSLINENDVKLENLCEKNCPTSNTGSYYSNQIQHSTGNAYSLSSASTTNSTPIQTAPSSPSNHSTEKINNTKNLFIQRINSLVIKTLAENMEKDKQAMSSLQNNTAAVGGLNHGNNVVSSGTGGSGGSEPKSQQSTPNSSPQHTNYFVGDTWKIKILQNTRVISTIKECSFVTEAILKSAENNSVVVSFDCEGINLGTKGQLTLLEIGTTRGEAFIFDILTCPDMLVNGGLKELLESNNVIKVIHDCRNDSVNLFNQYNILLRNIFDTQVGVSCYKMFHDRFIICFLFILGRSCSTTVSRSW